MSCDSRLALPPPPPGRDSSRPALHICVAAPVGRLRVTGRPKTESASAHFPANALPAPGQSRGARKILLLAGGVARSFAPRTFCCRQDQSGVTLAALMTAADFIRDMALSTARSVWLVVRTANLYM